MSQPLHVSLSAYPEGSGRVLLCFSVGAPAIKPVNQAGEFRDVNPGRSFGGSRLQPCVKSHQSLRLGAEVTLAHPALQCVPMRCSMPRLALLATLIFALAALPAAAQRSTTLSPFHSPVSLAQAEFAPDGALRSADISNASGQTITAIQFGSFIRHVDGQITTVVGKNNSIRGGM